MEQRWTRLGCVAVALAIASNPGQAQQTFTIGPSPSCAACSIEVASRRTFERSERADLVRAPVWISRDAAGYFYISEEAGEGGPRVYDAGGRFVRTLGRVGGGPGEFRSAGPVLVGPGDSLDIFDLGARARVRIAPHPGWTFIERSPAPWVTDVATLRSGRLVIGSERAEASGVRRFVHVADRTGRILRSMDGPDGPSPPEEGPLRKRAVAASLRGIWSGHRYTYRIDEWSEMGELFRTLTRTAPWFPAAKGWRPFGPDAPPQAELQAIHQDRMGLLWVLSTVAGSEWQRGIGEPTVRMGSVRGWSATDRIPQLLYDTVVDVIDPATASLVATSRLPGYYPFAIADGMIGGYRTDSDQVPEIEVLELRLVRRARPGTP